MKQKLCFAVLVAVALILTCCDNGPAAVSGLKLNASTVTFTAGQTFALVATVTPSDAADKEVIWSSDKSDIVSVEGGLLTAIAPGTAIITASSRDGGKTATCVATVSIVPVTSVIFDRPTLSMGEGSQQTLEATVIPGTATNTSLLWESSDPEVATVDDSGKITAIKPGSTTITVTAESDRSLIAECALTVKLVTPAWAKTSRTWVVGNQRWSDAINAPECNHADFETGEEHIPISTCRNNPGYGYLYTWNYVQDNQATLCPGGWHVPTRDDFFELDRTLGGNGGPDNTNDSTQFDPALLNAYRTKWGGEMGGYVSPTGNLLYQREMGYYWTADHAKSKYGYDMMLYGNQTITHAWSMWNTGYALRCVRNIE